MHARSLAEQEHDLLQLIRQSTREIASEYDRIRYRAREDPGTAGDEGEENWAEILRRWLPSNYHVVTKGRILTSEGETSPQVDVLVLSPSYPTGMLDKKLYLAAGVVAAFECKTTLRLQDVDRALGGGVVIRSIMRKDEAVRHRLIWGLLAHSHRVTAKAKDPIDSIADALTKADARAVTNPLDCIDFICIANLGTWYLQYFPPKNDDDETVISRTYMGPMLAATAPGRSQYNPDPIARFLTILTRGLGDHDKGLSSIAKYFEAAGLTGVGMGTRTRKWTRSDLPDDPAEALGRGRL